MSEEDGKEREFIEIKDMNNMWLLKDLLEINQDECYYCKKKLNRGDKISIFNKPDRIVCDSLLCISEAVDEDEELKTPLGQLKKRIKIRIDNYKEMVINEHITGEEGEIRISELDLLMNEIEELEK